MYTASQPTSDAFPLPSNATRCVLLSSFSVPSDSPLPFLLLSSSSATSVLDMVQGRCRALLRHLVGVGAVDGILATLQHTVVASVLALRDDAVQLFHGVVEVILLCIPCSRCGVEADGKRSEAADRGAREVSDSEHCVVWIRRHARVKQTYFIAAPLEDAPQRVQFAESC
eukprot:CAMPEP_0181338184 /NCGR_PEP_ID=MMETSP1101-20121128/28498_1 /TAXON_ID=46948 /ORGANISM="Rhodomonas abbreviata, Strain Caron Lab Isolate" /LENGTH=169 /DNA_ID=CAMNT_0023448891 /DNA_START=127 /DNA_END=633 /DNA_ORIENTATION=-